MSYAKAMKWNKNHIKGIKQMNMGFNASGITSEQIENRENLFIEEMKAKSQEERQAYYDNIQEMDKVWTGSLPWEWCAFERNFLFTNKQVI